MSKEKSQDIWNSLTLRIVTEMSYYARRNPSYARHRYQSVWEYLVSEGHRLSESEKERFRSLIRQLDEEGWFARLADEKGGQVRRWVRQACVILSMSLPRSFDSVGHKAQA